MTAASGVPATGTEPADREDLRQMIAAARVCRALGVDPSAFRWWDISGLDPDEPPVLLSRPVDVHELNERVMAR